MFYSSSFSRVTVICFLAHLMLSDQILVVPGSKTQVSLSSFRKCLKKIQVLFSSLACSMPHAKWELVVTPEFNACHQSGFHDHTQ